MNKQIRHLFLLSILFLVFILPRIIVFYADPDLSLTWSDTFLTDEIYHSGNALKQVLSGQWWLSDYNYIVMDPVIPFSQWLLFKTWKISLLTARLPSFFLSVSLIYLLTIFIYRCSREQKLLRAGMALFLLSSNYFLMVFGKMALLDIPMVALATMGLLFFSTGLRKINKEFWFLISAIFLLIALLTKASAVNFLIAIGFTLIIYFRQKKITRREFFYAVYGLVGIVIIYYTLLTLLHSEIPTKALAERGNILISEKIPHNIFQIIKFYITSVGNAFVQGNSPLFLLVFYVIYKRYGTVFWDETDTIMSMLIFSTFLFHGFFNYHPPRYYIVLSVPLTWFAVQFPSLLSPLFSDRPRKAIFTGLIILLLANGWNFQKSFYYTSHPAHSFLQTAELVKNAIISNGTKNAYLLDAGVNTSLPFYLKMDFDYGRSIPDDRRAVYLISGLKNEKGRLLGKYIVYKHTVFYLFRLR